MIQIDKNVRTSGAYVIYKNLFVFQVGPTRKGDTLGVVRLGGHKEDKETSVETAKREVKEEAAIDITIFSSPSIYYKENWSAQAKKIKVENEINPILIIDSPDETLSIMYMAHSENEPTPSAETNGLLLLSVSDIRLVCSKEITLNEYIKQGGMAILKEKMDKELILQPFPQLMFLAELLKEDPVLLQQILN
ncbi:DNA mismatch repair protein MutT [Bacillus thuringiensis serovar roskildiensis]|uniref:DNA mismatch repair protein MutT n=1 Tax=Bacillus thuringiensis serovar sooncheon TaxID=180891 RepID=A0A9Q5SIP3_BACTU|nr:NUDIX hydrolase [Bacillus thuringiensis]OTW72589.1 DNA mismatch repair protein MutT [Bacillus thuringiensis serovar coreanensis]OTX49645.1 DNA mismatch repair protein MutT [Bacillus thuringiensis serovar sooncheon]OTX57178.1 DNA mismatch repair protein MutT [Bacillus thuringiensis serovar guiyangiensis]OTX71978.1 DNA mismatch repair protein MutT [Bacillus thuringiensis serovar roskildiensis]